MHRHCAPEQDSGAEHDVQRGAALFVREDGDNHNDQDTETDNLLARDTARTHLLNSRIAR